MRRSLTLLGLALSGASAKSCGCSDVTFEVPVTSQNVAFASPPDTSNTTDIVEWMREVWRGNFPTLNGTTTVSDTFTIKGTYCVPKNRKADTLQVLVHGITYNKSMWAGFGLDDKYNWHAYANARGYASLAFDRLGHGDNPQRPDPLTVVQPQLQIDIFHQIISSVRGADNVLKQKFDKVVWVGHSWGSYLGAAFAAQYPADIEALVVTGYNNYLDFSSVIAADWVSAGDFNPARFGAGLAKGYVTMSQLAQRISGFYAGGFDAAIPPVDFAYEDTLTVGEIGGLPAILGPAAGYTGHVLAVTGVDDILFCLPPLAKCEELLNETASAFPDASSYDYFAPENTGHDLTLHYSAPETAKKVHDWLDGKL
jgi:pimeloyl-ACP methyl ester carboxylesterase